MNNFFKREAFTLGWTITINAIVAGISLYVSKNSNNISADSAFFAFTAVSSISIIMYIFKIEIVKYINEQSYIYTLVEKMKDKELRSIGFEQLNTFKHQLSVLSQGTITGNHSFMFEFVINKLKSISSTMHATHVATSENEMKQWFGNELFIIKNYYKLNVEIVKKKKEVKRIFILSKDKFFKGRQLNDYAKEVIKMHIADKIDVYLAWKEEIEQHDLCEDFVIVDDDCVYINSPTGEIFSEKWSIIVKKQENEIQAYRKKYKQIKHLSIPLKNPLTIDSDICSYIRTA